ncbi:MAG: arylsulfatase [Cyclobacteriaceae bacterium]|nr:MAG: arylsulfatase [Cyclobacteriaceae bacterium]
MYLIPYISNMTSTCKIYLTLTVFAAIIFQCKPPADEKPPVSNPNIIVILADDFGVGDIQAHYPDNKILTPNLDRLVAEGMSFNDAHSSSAVCSPTRYSLLTGRYAWRTPLQEWVLASYEPPLIQPERITLPEMLKNQGYNTACIGKWHLGWNWPGPQQSQRIEEKNALKNLDWDFTQPITGGPIEHGFDYYFGTHVPNFAPFTFIENDRVVELPTERYRYEPHPDHVVMPRGFEGTPMAPGWKFERILPEITERAANYVKEQSKTSEPFFLYFSMTSPHEPVVPSENFAGKSGIAPIADFVMETDWSVGRIMQAVEDAGISENTIILFTADNGHSHYTGWDELVAAGHMPSGQFRGHKGDIWEGGHRVPLVVKWPGKVTPSSTSDQLVCLTDVYETCYQLTTGLSVPKGQGEDSFSFLDILLNNEDHSSRQDLVSHSVHGEFAYRRDGWKIVYRMPAETLQESRGRPAKVELYHLGQDIAEQFDSTRFHPQVVARLTDEMSSLVNRGSSQPGDLQANDVTVDFTKVQLQRWATP